MIQRAAVLIAFADPDLTVYRSFDAWRRTELHVPDINVETDLDGTRVIWHFGRNRHPPDQDLIEIVWIKSCDMCHSKDIRPFEIKGSPGAQHCWECGKFWSGLSREKEEEDVP